MEGNKSILAETIAVVVAGIVISTIVVLVSAVAFFIVSWSVRQFGYFISWKQFIAAVIILIFTRSAISYIFNRGR